MALIFNNFIKYGPFRKIFMNNNNQFFPIHQPYASLKQSIEQKVGIPEKPKKPLTPYFRFLSKVRPSLIKNNPNLKITEIVSLAAQEWTKIDENTKSKLQNEYKNDLDKYHNQIDNYRNKLTLSQKEDLIKAKYEEEFNKEKRKFKKKVESLGKPKKPLPPFLLYLKDQKKDDALKYSEFLKNVSSNWKLITEDAKLKYMEKFKEDMNRYKKDLENWEEKMIRLGNLDVVRNEALVPKTKK